MRILAVFCCATVGLALVLRSPALSQRRSSSFAGTWKATDAVDDYERAAVIVIRQTRGGYELVDRTYRPTLLLRGKAVGNRLPFVWRRGRRTTRFVYTLTGGGNAL